MFLRLLYKLNWRKSVKGSELRGQDAAHDYHVAAHANHATHHVSHVECLLDWWGAHRDS